MSFCLTDHYTYVYMFTLYMEMLFGDKHMQKYAGRFREELDKCVFNCIVFRCR